MNTRELVFLDTETTGLDPAVHEVIEIAAIRTDATGNQIIGTYHVKVQPTRIEKAEPAALAINGYTADDWRTATDKQTALADLQRFVADAVVVGHNVGFDIGFIDAMAREQNTGNAWYKYKVDTSSMAWPLYANGKIEKPSLECVEKYFGISRNERHRALVDADTCRLVYLKLCNQ